MALHQPDPKQEEERLAHALEHSGHGHAHPHSHAHQTAHQPSVTPSTQGGLHLLSEKEQAELAKQQHERVKQALQEKAFEPDPIREEQERKKAEEEKKKKQLDTTLDKLAKLGLAPAEGPSGSKQPGPAVGASVQNPTNAIDFAAWIEASKPFLLPPVCNRLLYSDGQLKVMVVGGPNIRNDYHIEEGEEFFYQIKGDMCLKVIEEVKQ